MPVSVATPTAVELRRAAPAAIRAFFAIAAAWGLTNSQTRTLLGSPPESTFYQWKKGVVGTVSRDLLERVSYVLGIYKDLQILLPDPAAADSWVHRPNSAVPFGGKSALDHMLGGQVVDLHRVREYLDAERGGW